MNKERILMVADAIENHSIPKLGFNMTSLVSNDYPDMSGHDCKTVACIAGWTVALFKDDGSLRNKPLYTVNSIDKSKNAIDKRAGKILDLGSWEANDLFYTEYYIMHLEKITPKMAVKTLRNLAKTGRVVWDKVD